MANNLVSIISQIFGSQMLSRVATSLGINPALAQTLANAAVPAILASLGNLASTPAGAQKIADQIQSQDNNILGNLVNSLGSPGQTSFLTSGTGILSSLLGAGATSSLSGALAKFSGAEPAQAQSMLGVVTPTVFGALAQQDPAIWSSGEGIQRLFEREHDSISAALPAGLATALAGTGLLSRSAAAGDVVMPGSATAQRAEAAVARDNVTDMPPRVAPTSERIAERKIEAAAGGMPGWLKIAVPVALLALVVWFLMPSTTTTVTNTQSPRPTTATTAPTTTPAPTTTTTAPSQAQQAAVQLAEFAQRTNATIGQIATSLTGITNLEQARVAQPALEQNATALSEMSTRFGNLPTEARTAMAAPMQASLGTLNTQLGRVQQIPGTDFLKPTLDRISAAVASFK